jgi:hypothetical protein
VPNRPGRKGNRHDLEQVPSRFLDQSDWRFRDAQATPLRAVMDGSRTRPAGAPIGSEAWLRLLGEGGIEDLEEVLW